MSQANSSAVEFIRDAFCPVVAVLCSHEAEQVCLRNNLNFVEIVQPFCRLTSEIQIRDPGNNTHTVRNIKVQMRDMQISPPQPTLVKKLLNDVVANTGDSDLANAPVTTYGQYDLQLHNSTLWYDAYRETFLQLIIPVEHEYLRHFLACIFVVSSGQSEPMAQYQRLTQLQHQQQHQLPNKLPRWFCPNILRYYVLIHDVTLGNEQKADEVFTLMKQTYGLAHCHLLKINSSTESGTLPNPWAHSLEQDKTNNTDYVDDLGGPLQLSESLTALSDGSFDLGNSHPLQVSTEDSPSSPVHPTATNVERGGCLSLADQERLRAFVLDFLSRGLLPWAEKTLRNLSDQVQVRRGLGRTVNIGWKKFFGRPTALEKSDVVYTQEAPEMQMRRLGDLAFILQLYELAYSTYHYCKKDFQKDQAYSHLAGCLELSALSTFMQGSMNQRQYPTHYMEEAITTYLNTCKMPYFATRATLFHSEILKSKNLLSEAAKAYIQMTSEDSDLRSALLLEQAALCYLRLRQPMVRKYSFHMILAGHRFTKAAQRKHGLRCYQQALQVYRGKDWRLAEDHVQLTIGRQCLALKQSDSAVQAMRQLLLEDSPQTVTQQLIFFKEYLNVMQHVQRHDVTQLPLPLVLNQRTKVLCAEPCQEKEGLVSVDVLTVNTDPALWSVWSDLEAKVINGPVLQSSVALHCQDTDNTHHPRAIASELITVEVLLRNPLKIDLALRDVSLHCTYQPDDPSQSTPHFNTQVIPSLLLHPNNTQKVQLWLRPLEAGTVSVTGVLCQLSTTDDSHSVSGVLVLECQGHRLNATKHQRCIKTYAPDRRLDIKVLGPTGHLMVHYEGLPSSLLQGEVRPITVVLSNAGPSAVTRVHVASSQPGVLQLSPWGGRVQAGGSAKVKAFLRAPSISADEEESSREFDIQVVFGYETEGTGAWRSLGQTLTFTLHPSVQLSARLFPLTPCDLGLSLTAANCNKVPALAALELKLLQVLAISHRWRVQHMSIEPPVDMVAHPGETALMHFKVIPSSAHNVSQLNITDCQCWYDPLIFKDKMDTSTVTQATRLHIDLQLILLWQACRQAEGNVSYGQHQINVTELNLTLYQPAINQPITEQPPVKFIKSDILEQSDTSQIIRWSYDCPSHMTHDFSTDSLCLIPVKVHCFNITQDPVTVDIAAAPSLTTSGDGVLCVGQRSLTVRVDHTSQLTLTLAVTHPGVYNISNCVTVQSSQVSVPPPTRQPTVVIVNDKHQGGDRFTH